MSSSDDLAETVAELERRAESCKRQGYTQLPVTADETLYLLAAIKRLSEDAEVGEMLRRVEERWPRGAPKFYRWREGYTVVVTELGPGDVPRGEGKTRAAALRQLLGG